MTKLMEAKINAEESFYSELRKMTPDERKANSEKVREDLAKTYIEQDILKMKKRVHEVMEFKQPTPAWMRI